MIGIKDEEDKPMIMSVDMVTGDTGWVDSMVGSSKHKPSVVFDSAHPVIKTPTGLVDVITGSVLTFNYWVKQQDFELVRK